MNIIISLYFVLCLCQHLNISFFILVARKFIKFNNLMCKLTLIVCLVFVDILCMVSLRVGFYRFGMIRLTVVVGDDRSYIRGSDVM